MSLDLALGELAVVAVASVMATIACNAVHDGSARTVEPCYEGTVRMCCGSEGEQPGVNCRLPVPDGGIYGACRGEDEMWNRKVDGAYCCTGLVVVRLFGPNEAGVCARYGPTDLAYCAACGDGSCRGVENFCNCPVDCAPPDAGTAGADTGLGSDGATDG